MKIYFSGSIMGGRENEHIYLEIVEYLEEMGFDVPSPHVARRDLLIKQGSDPPQVIFSRDIRWIEASDAVIAEVSTPSLGVGYEVCHALRSGKPVLCVCSEGISLSKMILGNTSPNIQVCKYSNTKTLRKILKEFITERENGLAS